MGCKTNSWARSTLVAGACLIYSSSAFAQAAFPGAEGFGATVTGGRGGRVIHVTTLAESGPGSLREALQATGPRIIVFDVSGVIDLGEPNLSNFTDESPTSNLLVIPSGNVTIAGQSAPCGGVTIRGRLYAAYDRSVSNLIVRYLRVRPAAWTGSGAGGEQYDTVRFSLSDRVLLDHVSASFGVDETMDVWQATNVSVQWSVIGEAATVGHTESGHNYGLLNYGGRISVHHNLFAHTSNRNPALGMGPAETINNVDYNVRIGFVHHNPASGQFSIIGNYYRQGPNDTLLPFYFDDPPSSGMDYYLRDNYIDDPGQLVGSVDNPWTNSYFTSLNAPEARRSTAEFDFRSAGYLPVTVQSSTDAYGLVLAHAGALPHDAVDEEMVTEARSESPRLGSWGARYRTNLFEGLTTCAAPADTDRDGIADAWELAHGLNPSVATDNQTMMPGGYPAIEQYLNELADARAGTSSGGTPPDAGATAPDSGVAPGGPVETPTDSGTTTADAGTVTNPGGTNPGQTPPDGSVASVDAGNVGPSDGGVHASVDASVNASADARVEARADASNEAGANEPAGSGAGCSCRTAGDGRRSAGDYGMAGVLLGGAALMARRRRRQRV